MKIFKHSLENVLSYILLPSRIKTKHSFHNYFLVTAEKKNKQQHEQKDSPPLPPITKRSFKRLSPEVERHVPFLIDGMTSTSAFYTWLVTCFPSAPLAVTIEELTGRISRMGEK